MCEGSHRAAGRALCTKDVMRETADERVEAGEMDLFEVLDDRIILMVVPAWVKNGVPGA